MYNIYNNLNYLIETTNINLDDLCELIGITSNQYIDDYNNNNNMSLSIVQLYLLSDLFLIDIDSLVFDDLKNSNEITLNDNNKSLFGFNAQTLKSIISFHRVVKNYISLSKINKEI